MEIHPLTHLALMSLVHYLRPILVRLDPKQNKGIVILAVNSGVLDLVVNFICSARNSGEIRRKCFILSRCRVLILKLCSALIL